MATKTIVTCDVCKTENIDKNSKKQMQVIFTTEQNEGRGVENYFSNETIDICKECYKKALSGSYIFAQGAQGYNSYYFKIK